jgi:Tol biopolymer transport system component
MSRPRSIALAIAAASALATVAISPATATFPGDVGRLAFGVTGAGGNVDIWTALPNGHDLRRLTTSSAFDSCPAYSPDGSHIAFCSNRTGAYEIWTMDRHGGDQHAITSLGGRALFPTGARTAGRSSSVASRAPITTRRSTGSTPRPAAA